MDAKKLEKIIDGFTSAVTFIYNDRQCGVDPLSRTKYDVWYGDIVVTVDSLDKVMNCNIFDDKPLKEIATIAENFEY